LKSGTLTENALSSDSSVMFFYHAFANGKAQAVQMQRELALQKSHELSEVSDGWARKQKISHGISRNFTEKAEAETRNKTEAAEAFATE